MDDNGTESMGFNMDWYGIGQRIEAARDQKGISVETLSKMAGIKRKNDISALEEIAGPDGKKKVTMTTGKKKVTMTAEKLARISVALGISLDYLIFGKRDDPGQDAPQKEKTLLPYCRAMLDMVNDLGADLRFQDVESDEYPGFVDFNCDYERIRCLCIRIPLCSFKASENDYCNGFIDESVNLDEANYIQEENIEPWGVPLQQFTNEINAAHSLTIPASRNAAIENALAALPAAPLSALIAKTEKFREECLQKCEQEEQLSQHEDEDIPF